MIRQQMVRVKDGETFPSLPIEVSLGKAIEVLFTEFKDGGEVTEAHDRRLVTETNILGCRDLTIWEGAADEVRPLLVEACHLMKAVKDTTASEVTTELEAFLGEKSGNPFLLSLAGPFMIGRARIKHAAIAALCLADNGLIERLLKLKLGDVGAIIQMVRDGECGIEQAITLAE